MRILKLASFFIIWICVNHGVMADYLDPTGKTNVNVQTNLFKESVGNVQVKLMREEMQQLAS
jgi:hypothetical protein